MAQVMQQRQLIIQVKVQLLLIILLGQPITAQQLLGQQVRIQLRHTEQAIVQQLLIILVRARQQLIIPRGELVTARLLLGQLAIVQPQLMEQVTVQQHHMIRL
tara:strand:+ start:1148 stop:1456 length:309 start_codon:yes stop_codon:yes gene_type:complete